jgi:hypothetical protein
MKQKVKSNGRGVKISVEFLSKVKTPTIEDMTLFLAATRTYLLCVL